MIQVHVHDDKDEEISRVWMRTPPRKGELLWFTSHDWQNLRQTHGATSFEVTEVAHWVTSAYSPNSHVGEPIHSICAYVRTVPVPRPENDG